MRVVLVAMLATVCSQACAQSLQLEVINDHVFPTDRFGSAPSFGAFVTYKNELYFTAFTGEDPERGSTYGLFKTNGKTLTSFPVDPGFHIGTQFVEFQEYLYFRGDSGNGVELFRTDGVELTEFDLTESNDWGSAPRNFEIVGDRLYFAANPGDAGRAALMMLRDDEVSVVADVDVELSYPWHTAVGDDLYFTANGPDGYELYRHDGRNTELVIDANPGPGSSDPWPQAVWQGELVFTAINQEGRGLYITDNHSARQLPFPSDADKYGGPNDFVSFRDQLYFTANGENGYELYRTDGQTVREYDLFPGPDGSDPQTYFGDVLEGRLIVTGVGPEGPAIYVLSPEGLLTNTFDLGLGSDGYVAGYLREFNGEAYFEAGTIDFSKSWGRREPRLFKTDGESVTEVLIAPAEIEPTYLSLQTAVAHNGVLYLTGVTNLGGELVAIDGDGATVIEVFPGPRGSAPHEFHSIGDHFVFVARGTTGDAIYQIDDTGLSLVGATSPNTYIDSSGMLRELASVTPFTELGGQLLFLANTPDGFKLHRLAAVPEPSTAVLGIGACLLVASSQHRIRS